MEWYVHVVVATALVVAVIMMLVVAKRLPGAPMWIEFRGRSVSDERAQQLLSVLMWAIAKDGDIAADLRRGVDRYDDIVLISTHLWSREAHVVSTSSNARIRGMIMCDVVFGRGVALRLRRVDGSAAPRLEIMSKAAFTAWRERYEQGDEQPSLELT